jgi:hypothetical protein
MGKALSHIMAELLHLGKSELYTVPSRQAACNIFMMLKDYLPNQIQ